jgi:acyl carrier protein
MSVELAGSNYGRPYPPPGGEKELAMPNIPPQTPQQSPPETPPERQEGAHAAAPADGADSWLTALQEIQRQTSEAHAAYQHALADGHAAYLRTSEATLSGMLAAFDGAGGRPVAPPRPLPTVPAPARRTPPQPARSLDSGVRRGPAAVAPAVSVIPAPALSAPPPPVAALSTPATAPAPGVNGHGAGADLEQVVISVIAELTGYPLDVLEPEMELEHDLGIDSIKRVQILSRVRDRVPDLPSVDPAQLAGLSSIGETITYLRRQGSSRQPSTSADAEDESNLRTD